MKIRELLGDVAKTVESQSVATLIKNGSEKGDETAVDVLGCLLTAYNGVLNDVAINYLGLQATAVLSGEKVDLNTLSPTFKRVVDVKNSKGESISYAMRNGKIITGEKGATLIYEYIPENAVVDDDFAYYGKAVGYRAFFYGVASEYCLIKGRVEESANWESKYRQATEVKIDFKRRRLKAGKRWGL
ncbi:MAG: hypothetical protein IJY84_02815 [Clostridia bacterium]|nr:hypothetical protein [Clostridia bacterium]